MNYYSWQFGTEALIIVIGITFAGGRATIEFQDFVLETGRLIGSVSPQVALALTTVMFLFVVNESSTAYEFRSTNNESESKKEENERENDVVLKERL